MTTMIIAENIEAIMREKGLKAPEVARRAKINPTGVYDIISGKSRSPKVETLTKIADVLGVPVVALMERSHESSLRLGLLEIYTKMNSRDKERLLSVARALAGGHPAPQE